MAVSRSILLALLAMVLAAITAQAVSIDDCAPSFRTDRKECERLIKKCKNQFKLRMKWTGVGTQINGENKGDGGCQCDQYCGFLSPGPCRRDRQCEWLGGACYNKRTGAIGTQVQQCPLTPAPTNAPTTRAPTQAPTPTNVTAQVCIAPTDANMTTRLDRNVTGTCIPITAPSGAYNYKTWSFVAPSDGSLPFTYDNGNCSTNAFISIYSGSFNSTSLCTNYVFSQRENAGWTANITGIPTNQSMIVVMNSVDSTAPVSCCGNIYFSYV